MPTITVTLDKRRADRLARWARCRNVTKAEIIRTLIDRAGPIETGGDLSEWVDSAIGKGLGLTQRDREATHAARQLRSPRLDS